jgi:isopenicillin N synthase-like dioxygenase
MWSILLIRFRTAGPSATSGKQAHVMNALPNLDLSQLDGTPDERAAFLTALRETAHTVGFFYLSGHGIAQSQIDAILSLARAFFALPEADKLAIQMVHSRHFRGYNRAGLERTRGQPDWREQVDIGAERAALETYPAEQPWWRLQGPNQWPATLPALKPAALAYQAAVTEVAIKLVRAFAESLGQPAHALDAVFTPAPQQLLKIVRYPGRDATEGDQGVGAHRDGGFVTILLQDAQPGLQVEHDGQWVDAPQLPGTFVVNIGELFEMASNGYLRATMHRVVTPQAGRDRLSVPFFFGACLDASIPLLTLPAALQAGVRGLSIDPLNPLFRNVGKNQLKSRLRSHPDVAARHHADLADFLST